ncbi:MAG: tyrosine-type recombinase/integrase [Desulfobacteraceae bacterium]|nr:tyrosine-type recombinase/integrase [Desulfobacteraceae bacterium]
MADLIIKKGRFWYANCTYMKMLLRQSLKTEDKQIAIERLSELFMLVREGRYQFYKIKFDDLVSKYDPKVDRKNKLRNLGNHLIPEFKGKRLSEIDIQGWAVKITEKYVESTALAIIRVAPELGFQIDYKSLVLKPGKKFDGTQIVSEEMAYAVIANLTAGPRRKKYKSIAHVAMFSTMPLSDLLHLRKMDVVFKGKEDERGITYVRRKTRYKNKPALFVPMTRKLREAFCGVPTPIADEGLWFPKMLHEAVSQAVGRAFVACGWPHGRAMHNFRHFGACYLIKQGVPLTTIRELMGHSDFKTTLIYARTDRGTLIEGVKKFDAK